MGRALALVLLLSFGISCIAPTYADRSRVLSGGLIGSATVMVCPPADEVPDEAQAIEKDETAYETGCMTLRGGHISEIGGHLLSDLAKLGWEVLKFLLPII